MAGIVLAMHRPSSRLASCYSRLAAASRFSLIIRNGRSRTAIQHTGLPHPVLLMASLPSSDTATLRGFAVYPAASQFAVFSNRNCCRCKQSRVGRTRDLFSYDLTGELTNAQYTVPSGGSAARTADYTWDKAGNRTRLTDSVAGIYNYGVNNLNQYTTDGTSGGAITPGSEHELLNYQNVNYTYINDTHLSSVSGMDINGGQSTYQLSYDALGRCVARVLTGSTSSTTYYIYDGEKPILEYHSWSGPSAANVYGRGIDEILMRTDYSPNRTIYYQDDHEGSVTHLTDSSGAVIESYKYDAFGKPTINGGVLTASAFGNRFMFTGREYVSQFGIYEYRNRAYHPGLGRFMSEDPKLFDAGDNNFFRYCGNDPENRTDPMGLAAGPNPADMRSPDWGVDEQLADEEKNFEVTVDAHSGEMHEYARAEARTTASANSTVGSANLSASYVTYGGKWNEADAENFREQFNEEWKTPEGRKVWEERFSSDLPTIVSPYRGLPPKANGGASAFAVADTKRFSGENFPTAGQASRAEQDKRLSKSEIKALEKGGEHPHQLKEKLGGSRLDLFKDRAGNIKLKPRDGSGPGEPTGLNINDFL
jgi:RHS repeat-associated protein